MCKTRIKVIGMYTDMEDIEESVNLFISNPENKVAKVNSIKTEIYYDEYDEACMLATITYELGE